MSDTHAIAGVRLAAARAGLYASDRLDVAVLELAPGAETAAVFTLNLFCAAPVQLAREHLEQERPRLLLINAGCANAGTGAQGIADAQETCRAAAMAFGLEPQQVLPFSTGVIGEPLPVAAINAALPDLHEALTEEAWPAAAEAIMTTDTHAKVHSRDLQLSGGHIRVTGMAKGAGMICPDMATMLAFVATDLQVEAEPLRATLNAVLPHSFHAITVDGDTSTNDACVLSASGASGIAYADLSVEDRESWAAAVRDVCVALAEDIVRDAEGATRCIRIEVEQAASDAQAQRVARAVAHSPLVKTAAFAGDPNWGRILAAVGRSAEDMRLEAVEIWLDAVRVVRDGGRDPDYFEQQGVDVMQQDAFTIRICLGMGDSSAVITTSDLSYDYVKINAEYRT